MLVMISTLQTMLVTIIIIISVVSPTEALTVAVTSGPEVTISVQIMQRYIMRHLLKVGHLIDHINFFDSELFYAVFFFSSSNFQARNKLQSN